jgi:hypothetical protein
MFDESMISSGVFAYEHMSIYMRYKSVHLRVQGNNALREGITTREP